MRPFLLCRPAGGDDQCLGDDKGRLRADQDQDHRGLHQPAAKQKKEEGQQRHAGPAARHPLTDAHTHARSNRLEKGSNNLSTRVALHGFFSVFLFLLCFFPVCLFYFSTTLTSPPLCRRREGVYLS